MYARMVVSVVVAVLLLTLNLRDLLGQVDLVAGEAVRLVKPATRQDDKNSDPQQLSKIVKAFGQQARHFLVRYYDFRLGLRETAPDHAALRTLLLSVKAELADALADSRLKEFVLAELDRARELEGDAQLRRAVSELAFWLPDVPRLATVSPDRVPRPDIFVEQPWRSIKTAEVVLDCNTERLVNDLRADSLPDPHASGLEVYQRLCESTLAILEEQLAEDQGETIAELIEIERPAELARTSGCLMDHPVLIFLVKKTFRDKFDRDTLGQAKQKTFELKIRQEIQTDRDANGKATRYLVINEMLEPVLVGGHPIRGQYGLQYYKTTLSVLPDPASPDASRVQFRLLSVPDFRGRLANSRLRTAVSIFIHLENRDVIARTISRVQQLWPRRIADDLQHRLVQAQVDEPGSSDESPLRPLPPASTTSQSSDRPASDPSSGPPPAQM